MEKNNFAEHLHVSVMPVWVCDIFLRCENLLTASWFWPPLLSPGTVFSFFILVCMEGHHKLYECIRHSWTVQMNQKQIQYTAFYSSVVLIFL